ncbi:MAG: hypothetical protein V3U65_02380 [Granulosicoccaceae bacterium]
MANVRKHQRVWLIALLAACAILAATIAYIQTSDTQQILTGIDSDSINHISITQSNGQSILLERRDDQWQITKPTLQAANNNRIDPLLSIASIAPAYPSAEVDRKAAGLETPVASITFSNKRFDIGELDVSGKRRYAESDGQVYFFPEWIAPFIDGGVSALAAEPAN